MFDKSADEKREELEALHGSDVWDWADEEVHEEYNQLYADGLSLTEGDFSNIDEVDDEFDNRFGDWS